MKTTKVTKLLCSFLCTSLLWTLTVSPVLASGQTAPARDCLASIVVTNTNDSGAGSLRQALADVCAGGTITFDTALSGATIPLASTLTLTQDVSIDASALATPVTISGGSTGYASGLQVFYIHPGITVNLTGLTISKGFTSSIIAGVGGGILNYGRLTVTNSTISDNSAGDGVNSGSGGGIFNESSGMLTVTNSTISGNSTMFGVGGGIYNAGTLIVTNSIFSENSSNSLDASGGGGIYNSGVATVTNITLFGNSASSLHYSAGGGIFNGGTLIVADSNFSDNSAGAGDGSASGGGIANGGTLRVTNSTFSGNHIYTTARGEGGGIANGGTLMVTNSTFSANSFGSSDYGASYGGGIYNTGKLYYTNTIIANSPSGGDCFSSSAISANTNNLVKDGSCPGGGVKFKKGDPLLGPLADNGGPTQTFALLPGSPAIDAGNNAACAAAPVNNLDQRGVTRPQGARCDIGAYEYVPQERLTNGGFNDYAGVSKIPRGWVATGFSVADGKYLAAKHEGTASVRVTGHMGATKILKQTLALSGPAGTTFTFSFWTKGAGIPAWGICQAQVLLYSGNRLYLTKTVNCRTGTYGTFQQKTLSFTATTAFTKVVIRFTYAKASGAVWFDAVSLIE